MSNPLIRFDLSGHNTEATPFIYLPEMPRLNERVQIHETVYRVCEVIYKANSRSTKITLETTIGSSYEVYITMTSVT